MKRGLVTFSAAFLPSFRSFTYQSSLYKALPPRLQNVYDLAVSCDEVLSVADIGTDHGLLAIELTKEFQKVIGVDKSEQALQDGALSKDKTSHQVDFRIGDGLQQLQPKEADVICIAGMGVHTMSEILNPQKLRELETKHLILQPTNSRPRHLMLLYDFVCQHGWSVQDEYILYAQSRWYMTTRFDKSHIPISQPRRILPGSIVCKKHSMQRIFSDYVTHHTQWIQHDKMQNGIIYDEDQHWLETFARQ